MLEYWYIERDLLHYSTRLSPEFYGTDMNMEANKVDWARKVEAIEHLTEHFDETWSRVLSTPEKFKNGVFTLKTYQTYSVHTTPGKFENTTIIGHFGFVFEGNHMTIRPPSFSKRYIFKIFLSSRKRKADVSKLLRIEDRLHGKPNRLSKAGFSNFFGLQWTGPCNRSAVFWSQWKLIL